LAFVQGNNNANVCPQGYEKITTLEQCQAAATALNPNYNAHLNGCSNWNYAPTGCFLQLWPTNNVGFRFKCNGNDAHSNGKYPICVQTSAGGRRQMRLMEISEGEKNVKNARLFEDRQMKPAQKL